MRVSIYVRMILLGILISLVPIAPAIAAPDAPERLAKNPEFDQLAGCRHRYDHLDRSGEGQAGQIEWKARYYEIMGSLDFDAERFRGSVRAYLKPISSVDHLVLDAFDTLTEIEVRVDGIEANWTRLSPTTIDIETPDATVDQESVIEVDYVAAPNNVDFGAFWFPVYTDGDGNEFKMCQTMTETQNAGTWWPCIDRLSHKPDSLALAITVPDTMIVASNGLLEALDEPGADGPGSRTYHWRETYPIATYLVSITVAPYYSPGNDGLPWIESYDLGEGDSLPLHYFVRPHHVEEAQRNLPWIEDMLDAFRARFGEYPFVDEKYGVAEFSFMGGMEHQTISSISPITVAGDDSISFVQSHELAHQWFGDKVSPESWEDIWLNEGFATYSEAIYFEHFGRYSAGRYMYERRRLPGDTLFQGSVYAPLSTFSSTTYHKGGWVLHMLRNLLGDEDFFAILTYWADFPHEGGVANTADFQEIAEQISGQDLDAFFQRWVYGTGRPIYSVDWTSTASGASWDMSVTIQQMQAGTLFPDSLDVQVEFATAGRADSVIRIEPGEGLNSYNWNFDTEPVALTLDPEHRLLHNEIPGQGSSGSLTLYAPYPNPAGPRESVSIRLLIRESGKLRVEIFDVLGRRIRELADESAEPGAMNLSWDGLDDAGESQGHGLYFIRADLNGSRESRKILHLPAR